MDVYEFLPMHRKERFQRFHLNDAFARRFELEKELTGHSLCINRLAWNSPGSFLLSGSDDRRLVLSSFPDYERAPLSVETLHRANIFGVQFVPFMDDRLLVSGAMDGAVFIHQLEASVKSQLQKQATPAPPPPEEEVYNSDDEPNLVVHAEAESNLLYTHEGRVKDVEVDESARSLVWSVGEDGTVRQADLRDDGRSGQNNALIRARRQNTDGRLELKGLDVNKIRPHLMAVACEDAYVRVYDRRMLSTGNISDTMSTPLMMLAPPHMTTYGNDHSCGTTYVNFSHKGDKVVNHGLVCLYQYDHCYNFDITSEGMTACTYHRSSTLNTQSKASLLPKSGHQYKEEHPLWMSTRAICDAPHVVHNYLYRAQWLSDHNIHGDHAFALRDCDQAIAIDPHCKEAHFLRCQELNKSHMPATAFRALKRFLKDYPEEATSKRIADLETGIYHEHERKRRSVCSTPSSLSIPSELDQLNGSILPTPKLDESSLIEDEWDKYYTEEFQKGCPDQSEKMKSPGGVWWSTQGGCRLLTRYFGHFSNKTDIKECAFIGQNDQLIACGSDDGRVYIYDAESGRPLNILEADSDFVNCVQSHPSVACLATSGLDSTVKLWTPGTESRDLKIVDDVIRQNRESLMPGPASRDPMVRVLAFLNHIRSAATTGSAPQEMDESETDESGSEQQCQIN